MDCKPTCPRKCRRTFELQELNPPQDRNGAGAKEKSSFCQLRPALSPFVLNRGDADRIDAFQIRTLPMSEASRGSSEPGGLSPAANGGALKNLTLLLGKEGVVDEAVRNELFRAVYAELRAIAARKMASERPGHTLQATALVHEAWMRLGCGETAGGQAFENRAHFFSAAAEAMRRILVEAARRKGRDKRGAGAEHVDVDVIEIAAPAV